MKKKLLLSLSICTCCGMIFSSNINATEHNRGEIQFNLEKRQKLDPAEKGEVINLLKNGNEDLKKLKERLAKIRNDDYDSLNRIARELFENEEIELVHNPNLAKRWIEEWFKIITVFPQIKGKVRLIANEKPFPDGYPDCFAETGYIPGVEVYDITYYKNMEDQEKCKEAERKGLFAKGPTTEYTVVHELGHAITFFISDILGKNLDINIPYVNITEEKDSLEEEILKISRYPLEAASKTAAFIYDYILNMETIAEAFADVNTSGESAAPLSKEIVFYIYEMIKK